MRERGNRDQLTVATKVGARSNVPGDPGDEHWEGLSAPVIDEAVKGGLERLGVDRIDLYYAHIDDRRTPLDDTVGALGRLAADGVVDVIGCSNTTSWRLERARQLATDQGVARYEVIQQRYTYLWASPLAQGAETRLGSRHFPHAGAEHLDYLEEHRDVTLVAYAPLMEGRTRIPIARSEPNVATRTRPRTCASRCSARSRMSSAPRRTRSCSPGCCTRIQRSSRSSGPHP